MASLQLNAVTAIRFEFALQAQPGRFGGTSVYFADGSMGELGAATCGSAGSVVRPPPPPPPAPSPPVDESGLPATCASFPDFMTYSDAVTTACCSDPAVTCPPGGIPSACTAACADILLPMQSRCVDMLAAVGMTSAVDAAVATCPPPPARCGTFPEFMQYNQQVTAACCSGEFASSCVAGLPSTSCDDQCAAVLLPMQRACSAFLISVGMQDTISGAVAACGSGH